MRIENERGFTLIESLLHCLIFSVVALGLALLLVVCYNVPTTTDVFEETEMEVVSFDVNRLLLQNVQAIEQKSPQKLAVRMEGELGVFEFIFSKPYLYRSKAGGFEPLLATVNDGSYWSLQQDMVMMTLINDNSFKKERAFYVPTVP